MRTKSAVWQIALLILIVAVLLTIALTKSHAPLPPSTLASQPSAVLGSATKQSGCSFQGALPDRACTPGRIIASATKEQICSPGYAHSVRNVPYSEKQQVYAAYGIDSRSPGQYEVDHLISLELGGSNEIANLWPEAAEPTPGFHQKDAVENYLHDRVCRDELSLAEAQEEIASDWRVIYTRMTAARQ